MSWGQGTSTFFCFFCEDGNMPTLQIENWKVLGGQASFLVRWCSKCMGVGFEPTLAFPNLGLVHHNMTQLPTSEENLRLSHHQGSPPLPRGPRGCAGGHKLPPRRCVRALGLPLPTRCAPLGLQGRRARLPLRPRCCSHADSESNPGSALPSQRPRPPPPL